MEADPEDEAALPHSRVEAMALVSIQNSDGLLNNFAHLSKGRNHQQQVVGLLEPVSVQVVQVVPEEPSRLLVVSHGLLVEATVGP